MHRRLLIAVVGLLAIGLAGSARAATLDFTGTLGVNPFGFRDLMGSPIYLTVPGAGSAQVTDDGSLHLLSFALSGGTFGPSVVTTGITPTYGTFFTLYFSIAQNLAGSFSGISGGPPGGGPMGLSGMAKVCLVFAPCEYSNASLPLTPTSGGAGFGIGGTAIRTAAVAVTMQHATWTIGQPTMTIHTANSTITIPVLPAGFAHGPASLASSTAQPGGVVQLVTVSKAHTSLYGALPQVTVPGVLTLRFVPEPGTLLLLGLGVAGLAAAGRRRSPR